MAGRCFARPGMTRCATVLDRDAAPAAPGRYRQISGRRRFQRSPRGRPVASPRLFPRGCIDLLDAPAFATIGGLVLQAAAREGPASWIGAGDAGAVGAGFRRGAAAWLRTLPAPTCAGG